MDTLRVRLGLTHGPTFLLSDTIPQAHLLLMSLTCAKQILYTGVMAFQSYYNRYHIKIERLLVHYEIQKLTTSSALKSMKPGRIMKSLKQKQKTVILRII